MNPVFALDIGGTAVKYGLVTEAGQFLRQGDMPFERDLSFALFVDRLAALHGDMTRLTKMSAIAIATPGYASPATGVVIDGGGNVPVLRQGSLAKALSERLTLPAWMENDGVAAAIGELRFGVGRRLQRFVLLTIGTGVGGAVVLNGAPVTGVEGAPPELGAIVVGVDENGATLNLEEAASASAFVRAHARATSAPAASCRALFDLARAGDSIALKAIDGVCRHIAFASGALINALALDAVVLGGGVSGAGELLAGRVRAHLPAYTWPYLAARAGVRIAALGNSAGLLGAAAVAFARLSKKADSAA